MSSRIVTEKVESLDIQLTISQAQELMQKKFLKLMLVTFVSTLVSMCSFGILIGIMTLHLFSIVKKLDEDSLYEPSIQDLFSQMKSFKNATLLFLIFVGVGIVFAILLNVLISASFVVSVISYALLTPLFVLSYMQMVEDPNTSPITCFTLAFDAVKASPKNHLLVGLLMGVIIAIPAWFGLILSIPLHTIAQGFNSCLSWRYFKNISSE